MTLSHRKQAERAELLARAALVRPLIKEGHVDPLTGLYYVVWPTAKMLEAERQTDLVRRWELNEAADRRRRGKEAA